MTKSFIISLLLLVAIAIHAQTPRRATPEQPLNVAFWIFPDVVTVDLTGPMEVFVKASRMTRGSYRIYTVAATDTLLRTEAGGLTLRPDYTVANAPAPDILVIPGMPNNLTQQVLANQPLLNQLRALAGRSQSLLSVCTGAYWLGQLGLLDGRRVTTHWAAADSLARRFPKAIVVRRVRYVQDGKLTTTAGVTAGIDGALRLVEQHSGRAISDMVMRAIEYTPQPPFDPNAGQMPMRKPVRQVRSVTGSLKKVVTAKTDASARKAVQPAAQIVNATDPVCHMRVSSTTVHRHTHQSKTYGFCAASCRAVFAADPATYLK